MNQYEIEIKVLLWEEKNAVKFKEDIKSSFPSLELIWKNSQLNHYFVWWDLSKLRSKIISYLNENEINSFDKMLKDWKSFSFRTRFVENKSILVIKFSLDDSSSDNWVSRREWEHQFDLDIDSLDKFLLESDFSYQAKWSREREEYKTLDINICLDKNAWYGYLAEFEMVLDLSSDPLEAKKYLLSIIDGLWYQELPQDRLERMFAYYNENWRDYYGSEKTFVIE